MKKQPKQKQKINKKLILYTNLYIKLSNIIKKYGTSCNPSQSV